MRRAYIARTTVQPSPSYRTQALFFPFSTNRVFRPIPWLRISPSDGVESRGSLHGAPSRQLKELRFSSGQPAADAASSVAVEGEGPYPPAGETGGQSAVGAGGSRAAAGPASSRGASACGSGGRTRSRGGTPRLIHRTARTLPPLSFRLPRPRLLLPPPLLRPHYPQSNSPSRRS